MRNSSERVRTVNLGPEYDVSVWNALKLAIREAGGKVEDRQWGVAGSQELVSLEIDIEGRTLLAESETYIGTTITGEGELVDRIANRVRVLLGAS